MTWFKSGTWHVVHYLNGAERRANLTRAFIIRLLSVLWVDFIEPGLGRPWISASNPSAGTGKAQLFTAWKTFMYWVICSWLAALQVVIFILLCAVEVGFIYILITDGWNATKSNWVQRPRKSWAVKHTDTDENLSVVAERNDLKISPDYWSASG